LGPRRGQGSPYRKTKRPAAVNDRAIN